MSDFADTAALHRPRCGRAPAPAAIGMIFNDENPRRQNYAFNFHYSDFNSERLGNELLRAGFAEVRPWNPAEVAHHEFDDWASRRLTWRDREFPVSLNLEGVK